MAFRAKNEDEKLRKAQEVANRLTGDIDHGVEPQNVTEIRKAMNFKQTTMVYKYKELAIKNGFLALDEKGEPVLPQKTESEKWRLYTKNHKLALNPLMARWLKKQNQKSGGHGVGKTRDNFNTLERLLNSLRITPEQLVTDKSELKVEGFRDDYMIMYNARKDWNPHNYPYGSSEGRTLVVNYALVSFCSMYGMSWIRGDEVMNRRVVGHAKYGDVRFTKEEFVKANQWILDNHGLDSNVFRWFWTGVETAGRDGSSGEVGSGLYGFKLQWDVLHSVTKKGEKRITFFMKMFESKTKKIQDGIYPKWIKRTDTQKSYELLKKRGGSRIWESDMPKHKFIRSMNDEMRKLYTFLGKDPESLFFKRPSHVLRHLSAHYWLSKGNYKNHVEVATLGAWNTVDEMIKSYGQFPPEKMNEYLDEYDYE